MTASHTPAQRQEYAARYAQISRKLLQQAEAELDVGDALQASEKMWGAAAHAIKSVAESRGWNHQHHGLLNDAVNELRETHSRPDLIPLYDSASFLHNNFYEHEYQPDAVRARLPYAQELIERLEELRPEPPQPIESRSREQRRRLSRLTDPARAHERRIPIEELPEVWPTPET